MRDSAVICETTSPTVDSTVHLRLLSVPPEHRGRGLATAALRDLCARADAHGWTVELAATNDFGADVRRLMRWYGRHGFVLDRSRPLVVPAHIPMVRRPVRTAALSAVA